MSAQEKAPTKASGRSAQASAGARKGTKKRAAKKAAAVDTPASSKQKPPKSEAKSEAKRENKREKKREGKRGNKGEAKRSRNPLEYLLPVVSLAVALVGAAVLYRHFFIEPKEAAAAAAVAASASVVETPTYTEEADTYEGVVSPWCSSGYFTTGYMDLDEQIKQFCDALSEQNASARHNAQLVYNQIIWSGFEGRTEDQKPSGDGWEVPSARHYFSTGSPADGVGGTGDYYEYAAVTSFCLRYFGYVDAFATPALSSMQESIAVCLVTDENGSGCVCDPSLLADGWMLNRNSHTVTVEDLGQDLTKVEALGLRVVNSSAQSVAADAGTSATDTSSYAVDESYESYDETYEEASY